MRRPVRINYLWYTVGTRKMLIPATGGELEHAPPRSLYHAELFWLLPDGGADSRGFTRQELELCFMFRQPVYIEVPERGRGGGLPSTRG